MEKWQEFTPPVFIFVEVLNSDLHSAEHPPFSLESMRAVGAQQQSRLDPKRQVTERKCPE